MTFEELQEEIRRRFPIGSLVKDVEDSDEAVIENHDFDSDYWTLTVVDGFVAWYDSTPESLDVPVINLITYYDEEEIIWTTVVYKDILTSRGLIGS